MSTNFQRQSAELAHPASVGKLSTYWAAIDQAEAQRRKHANQETQRQIAALSNSLTPSKPDSPGSTKNSIRSNRFTGAPPHKPFNPEITALGPAEIEELEYDGRPLRLHAVHMRHTSEMGANSGKPFNPQSHHLAEAGWNLESVRE